MKRKKPKFKIGDTVVITMYGTVGIITNIQMMDEEFLYEVNHGESLYFENSLEYIADYEGSVYESEMVEVELKFNIGDLVYVKGYGKEVFKIVGYRTELWRYQNDAWEEVTYELVRFRDGEWLEATTDELKMVIQRKDAEKHLQNIHIIKYIAGLKDQKTLPALKSEKKENGQEERKKTQQTNIIDSMLDLYNDYKLLYEFFGDEEYKEMMNNVIQYLKRAIERRE